MYLLWNPVIGSDAMTQCHGMSYKILINWPERVYDFTSVHQVNRSRLLTALFKIYFGPQTLTGTVNNWVQTLPKKGWNGLFRLYGPLELRFDKVWCPGEIEFQLERKIRIRKGIVPYSEERCYGDFKYIFL